MVPVAGGEVWAEDSGGDGEALVLLHPGIGDLRVWEPVWPALTQDYRVIRYDARGYGGSPQPTAPYTWIDDLAAVLGHAGIDSAHLVGNSNGGATAIGLALARPDAVRSLVLLAPSVTGYPWPPDDPELDARYEAAVRDGEQAMVEFYLDLWCAAGHEPLVRELVLSSVRAQDAEERFARELPPQYDRLGELAVPTVILVGDRDRAALVEANLAMAQRIPGCRLIRAAGVDHLPSLRVPDLVVQTVRETCRPS